MKPLMVSGRFPCVRAGKITEALRIPHDALCRMYPPQLDHAYDRIHALRSATMSDFRDFFRSHDYDLIHVHNEPNWPVVIAKEAQSAPVLMNVHDVTSARPGWQNNFDPYEDAAYEAADAFVFVSEWQRDFCIQRGLDVEGKPYVVLPNYASESTIVEKPILPHLGGVVYAGGLDARGRDGSWRDLSPVADAVEGIGQEFHVYPGNPGIDYGTVHKQVMDYSVLTHRIAQHDWGFSGTVHPNNAWEHSYPNKVFEYFMAGIPVVALNNPLVREFCDKGLGIYLDDISDIRHLKRIDRKKYVKNVLRERYRYTMSYNIEPLRDLYKQLRGQ